MKNYKVSPNREVIDFVEHKDFDEALDCFKREHPDCKIETFSGDLQQIVEGFDAKDYSSPRDKSFPKYLIKVGQKEHMNSLLKKGEVYMNPLGYFRDLERTGDGRADDSEGAHSILQINSMLINGLEINTPTPVTFFAPGHNEGYIYCLIGVYDDTDPTEILNEKILGMGSIAIVVHEPEAFVRRCANVLKANSINLDWGRVRYYDKTDNSYLLDPWLKPKDYEYQHEFRLYFPRVESKAIILDIGSIEDIASPFLIKKKK